MTIAAVVLAAGRSRRFGVANKLLAEFRGQPLAAYAADLMRGLSVDYRMVITSSADTGALFDGFDIIHAPDQTQEQSDSLRLAVDYAEQAGADRLLVLLADMPLLTQEAAKAVLARVTDDMAAAVTDGMRRMPPACFPKAMFDDLRNLRGDRGAGALLKMLPEQALVPVPAEMLADIDMPERLQELS